MSSPQSGNHNILAREAPSIATQTGTYPDGRPILTFAATALEMPSSQPLNVLDFGARGDGVTDDTTAIQAALNAASSVGGGIVFLPAGIYVTSAALVIPASNIILRGSGFGTIIKPITGATFDVIATPISPTLGATGYTIQYIVIEDLKLDCSQMAGTVAGQGNAIHLFGAQWSYVNRVYVLLSPNWAFCLEGTAANATYNCHVTGCLTQGCAGGIYCASEASDIVMNVLAAFNATLAAPQPTYGTQSNIAYNLVGLTGRLYIAHNVFGGGGTQNTQSVWLNNSVSSRVIANSFDTPKFEAIHVGGANQSVIAFNQFIDPMFGGTAGAIIHAGANEVYIAGNSVLLQNAKSYTYCVDEAGAARTGGVYESNQFIIGNTGMFNLAAGSTTTTRSNVGYNPRGASVTQLAIAATGVALTNTTGCDCMLLVGGGTITQIAIGGVNTGQTSGWLRIPAGQTITVTYSVAPTTFQWFGD